MAFLRKDNALLIGLSGSPGAGKDHTASIMVGRYDFARVGLADAMKRHAREIWGFSDLQLFGASKHRNAEDERYPGLSPRCVLQTMGSDVRRYDVDAWVRLALRTASELLTGPNRLVMAYSAPLGLHFDVARTEPHAGVVIPDVRYNNEARAIRAQGGIVVRVKRNGSGLTGAAAHHESELELNCAPDDAFEAVIDNNGGHGDLESAIERLMRQRKAA